MADTFESRVRCAAIAGWWTLLIGVGVFLVQWILYLVLGAVQPAWLLTLWGPGADWQQVRTVWFWFLAGFKAFLFLVAFLLMWITLWARQMRKGAGSR